MWRGSRRFYDDAAVFVGGIPFQESQQNLLERFSKHGKVVALEYERRHRFADARVMFETKTGAESAMLYEVRGLNSGASRLTEQNGAIIDGHAIRVRDRRIPAHFVEVCFKSRC